MFDFKCCLDKQLTSFLVDGFLSTAYTDQSLLACKPPVELIWVLYFCRRLGGEGDLLLKHPVCITQVYLHGCLAARNFNLSNLDVFI